ncbi:MAG: DNA polymerase IV [Syntrophales bacterium]|nr:DNA polymerase IV [Syntrophales bacterium]MDY0044191.1 DNA polymerase IV [Syntrophales bacterium]
MIGSRIRRILHIDMDAFFAAVEEKRRSELAGKPVIIGGLGDPLKRGVVSTANYNARTYGIHSGMPLRTAYKLCPQAVFLPVDYSAYSAASELFKGVLKETSLLMEDVGIDEAYLDITEVKESSERIAGKIKRGIFEKTGLTCSIGIAPNKLLAKIASDMEKPDGLTIILEHEITTFLRPLPIRKLYGVGPKMEGRLKKAGIETVGQITGIPLERLIYEFGNSYGRYLYCASRGIDETPLTTHWQPKSSSRETTFQEDVKNWQKIASTLALLTRGVVKDIRNQGYCAKTITLKIRFSDFKTYTRSLTLPAFTESEKEIREAAFSCLKRIDLNRKVRLIGVRASNLVRKNQ